MKIADKILEEEKRIEQRKKQQPYLWKDPKNDKTKVGLYNNPFLLPTCSGIAILFFVHYINSLVFDYLLLLHVVYLISYENIKFRMVKNFIEPIKI